MKKLNNCSYSPGKNKHNCTHQHYCIFNKNRTQLEQNIHEIETKLTQFENIKNAAINGEAIYHKELDTCYEISIDVYTGTDGETHYKTDVQINDKFMGVINLKIENLRYDLKNLINYRLDILHGKVDGYGI